MEPNTVTRSIRLRYLTRESFRNYDPDFIDSTGARPAYEDPIDVTVEVGATAQDGEVCEIVWDRFNRHDDPDQHPALDALKLRSLSVGDIVSILAPCTFDTRNATGTVFPERPCPGHWRDYRASHVGFEQIEL